MKMKACTKLLLLLPLLTLPACADDFRLGDPLEDSRAWCGEVYTADTPWKAGCATQNNLVMLAEKSDDLILPRSQAPRSLILRGRMFEGHGQTPSSGSRPARSQTPAGLPSHVAAEGTQ